MSTWVMFTQLTEEGRKRERTGEKSREINKGPNQMIEDLGGKVLHQYALLGPYDFVNILEAPSKEVIVRIAMEVNAMGLAKTVTMPATSIAELKEIVSG